NLENPPEESNGVVSPTDSQSDPYSAFSREDLIKSIRRLEKKNIELLSTIREQESHIQEAREEVDALKVEKAKLELSYETLLHKAQNEPSMDVPYRESMDTLSEAIATSIRHSSVEDRQIKCISKLKSRVSGMDSIIQKHALLINNQEEALSSLCNLVSRVFDTIDEKDRTDEQDLLYQEFQLAYLQNDNSDVENVLDVDPYPTRGSSIPFSPLPTTPRATDDADFSLASFLQYVSATMISPSFQNESLALSDKAVSEIRAFVSSFLDGITAILQSRVQKGKWVTNDSVHNCGNCKRCFSISRRKHHCRWCGRVFCGDCSRHRVRWAFLGRNQRLCDNCYCVYVNLPLSLHELFSSH
ncbi:hypothetical protein WA556_005509, partial [Blastocystis sp. ATCC 50177/Nand II]